jgi:CPA2 family monovalent cation:H+ antiporter-2
MESGILLNLVIVMVVAGIVTFVFRLLRQPVVLGYILAGLLIGPHTPWFPLEVEEESLHTMADLGIILLLFNLGLEFNLRKLAKVGLGAGIAAPIEIGLMVWIGFQIGRIFGWSTMDTLFLGPIIAISSSTIIVKSLGESRRSREPFAQMIFGLLIVEDIVAVAILALLSGVALTGSLDPVQLVTTLGKMGIFFTTVLVAGLLAVPWMLRYAARFKSNEMLLIITLGLCFGVSYLAAVAGFSVALGAFLIGAVVAEAREAGRVTTIIEPVRDMFSAVFFVTIGMLIQPAVLLEYAVPIGVIALCIIVGKTFGCALGAFLAGYSPTTALQVGTGMAQVGEFSYIIASLGLSLGVVSDRLYPVAVSVSAITILCSPYLMKSTPLLVRVLRSVIPETLANYLRLYHRWVSESSSVSRPTSPIQKVIRRSALQILLNLVLIAGLLIGAASIGYRLDPFAYFGIELPRWTGGSAALLWLGAMIVSMPLVVATLRKLHAMAMIVSEISIPRESAGERTQSLRGVVTNVIVFAGVGFILFWLFLLSTAILPPWPIVIVLLAVIIGITAVLWRSFIHVYARAQVALRETLSAPIEHADPLHSKPIATLLQAAQLDTVVLDKSSPGRGRLIRELEIRSRTGASVIGIERDGTGIVNPSADEELLDGDKVLLIGSTEQLAAGKELLAGTSTA